eukprot:1743334-Prymnesium_polylepis.2
MSRTWATGARACGRTTRSEAPRAHARVGVWAPHVGGCAYDALSVLRAYILRLPALRDEHSARARAQAARPGLGRGCGGPRQRRAGRVPARPRAGRGDGRVRHRVGRELQGDRRAQALEAAGARRPGQPLQARALAALVRPVAVRRARGARVRACDERDCGVRLVLLRAQ